MLAGLVMGPGAVDGAIVLGHVEVNRPWTEGIGHGLISSEKLLFAIAILE